MYLRISFTPCGFEAANQPTQEHTCNVSPYHYPDCAIADECFAQTSDSTLTKGWHIPAGDSWHAYHQGIPIGLNKLSWHNSRWTSSFPHCFLTSINEREYCPFLNHFWLRNTWMVGKDQCSDSSVCFAGQYRCESLSKMPMQATWWSVYITNQISLPYSPHIICCHTCHT